MSAGGMMGGNIVGIGTNCQEPTRKAARPAANPALFTKIVDVRSNALGRVGPYRSSSNQPVRASENGLTTT
jgi:hypothetical protein